MVTTWVQQTDERWGHELEIQRDLRWVWLLGSSKEQSCVPQMAPMLVFQKVLELVPQKDLPWGLQLVLQRGPYLVLPKG